MPSCEFNFRYQKTISTCTILVKRNLPRVTIASTQQPTSHCKAASDLPFDLMITEQAFFAFWAKSIILALMQAVYMVSKWWRRYYDIRFSRI
jgi:hypothetical protein